MKKLLTGILAFVLIAGTANAQTKRDGARSGKESMMMKNLNLTADQQARLKTLREAQKKEMETLKNTALTVDQRNARRKEIHQKYKDQYSAILTPAQKQQMEQKRAQWGEKGKARGQKSFRGGQRGLLAHAEKIASELNLTTDQRSRLQNIYSDFQAKSTAIRSNNALSNDQKREQSKTLADQYMNQAKAVLSADQLKKFNEMKSSRSKGGKKGKNFKR